MEDNNNSLIKSALVLALIVAGFLGYLYFKEKRNNQEALKIAEVKTLEMNRANQLLDSLYIELNTKIEELTIMGQQVDELEAVKRDLEIERTNLRNRPSGGNLRNLEAKIREYEEILARKDREINLIREENVNLAESNTALHRDNVTLEADKSALKDSVVEYSRINRELEEKINIGAALRPIGYVVSAINKRGKERDGIEFKARRVDRIKLNFRLAENPLTQPGVKTIYMRLLNPEGNVIYDMALGSGVFTFAGKETIFTTRQNINYTNSNQEVEFIYDNEQRLAKGNYSIELYSEGFRVGQTSFTIK